MIATKYEEENGVSRYAPETSDLRGAKIRVKTVQNFDKKKLFVTKAGQKINCYDKIQESLPDTEIYTVMDKYGCTFDEAKERMKSNLQEIRGMFDMNVQFQDVLNQQIKAEEQFSLLPLEIREQFGNNLNRFLAEGKEWLDKNYPVNNTEIQENIDTEQKEEGTNV